ncbi:MAG: HTH domain-containing protein [Bacteroidota bacterium]|nr:HTH domain-containing protein [Bacteroidota bacterium]
MDDQTTRLSRLTAILTLLLSKQLLTSTEISKKFNISVRTVYRDIRALEEAGVPVITDEGKGYSILDGYKLPPVMFTEKEAYALITTEQIVLKSKDASLVKEFTEAIAKIKSVLRNSNKQKTELLSERVYIGKNWKREITSENLIELQLALTNFQLVKISYQPPEAEATERVIEPFVIYNSPQDDWTLVAYCRLRKDFRSFRLDRMTKLEVLQEYFEPHKLTMKHYAERYS